MKQKYWCIRGNRIQFIDSWETLLHELMLGEASNYAHPLRRWCDSHLLPQHRQGVSKRTDTIPAKLHIEVKPAPDDVKMIVDQSRQNASSLEVDNFGGFVGSRHNVFVVANSDEFPILNGQRRCRGVGTIKGRD